MSNVKTLPPTGVYVDSQFPSYKLGGPHADTMALSSAELLRTLKVHLGGDGLEASTIAQLMAWEKRRGVNPGVNPRAFLDLNNDPRFEKLRENARDLGKRYNNPKSESYVADVKDREAVIANALVKEIYKTYGSYNQAMSDGSANSAEKTASGYIYNETPKLKDVEYGSMVCRHYAPVMSVLLEEAGVCNHLIASGYGLATLKGKQWEINKKYEVGYHEYVITDKGNAIVEATVAGKNKTAYYPVINKYIDKSGKEKPVTVDEIVYHGHAALTKDGSLYGGHTGYGSIRPDKVAQGQHASLDRYNAIILAQYYKKELGHLQYHPTDKQDVASIPASAAKPDDFEHMLRPHRQAEEKNPHKDFIAKNGHEEVVPQAQGDRPTPAVPSVTAKSGATPGKSAPASGSALQ